MQFSSISPMNRTLSSDITQGQSDGNEGVLRIAPALLEPSPSDCLVSYLGHSLDESYLSAAKQSVYSTVQADWARWWL